MRKLKAVLFNFYTYVVKSCFAHLIYLLRQYFQYFDLKVWLIFCSWFNLIKHRLITEILHNKDSCLGVKMLWPTKSADKYKTPGIQLYNHCYHVL